MAEYLARAAKAGISWPLPEGVDAEALDAALFPAVAAEVANRGRPVPDWRAVHRRLSTVTEFPDAAVTEFPRPA